VASCLSRPRLIGLDEGVTPEIAETIDHVRESTDRLLAALDELTDADVARPSLCPEWTVGHVLTHLARSGDGIRRGLEGARRGEVAPMYDSLEARAADIEAGATRPMAELIADVAESSRLVAQAWSEMDDAAWEGTFQHRLGPRPVRATPEMRWREVEIHRVDLAGDYGPADWSQPFIAHVLDEGVHGVSRRLPAGVGIDLSATDTGARLSFGTGRRVGVSGPSWALAAWLLGRPASDLLSTVDGSLPELKPWA
jgi:maleylpyruvate isomerase